MYIRQPKPGDLFTLTRSETFSAWWFWSWTLTAALVWWFVLASEVTAPLWAWTALALWVALIVDFSFLYLAWFLLWSVWFPIGIPLAFLRGDSRRYISDPKEPRNTGLSVRHHGHHWRAYRCLWLATIFFLVVSTDHDNRLLIWMTAASSFGLVFWNANRCLRLMTKPNTRDWFPDWAVNAAIFGNLPLHLLHHFSEDDETAEQKLTRKEIVHWYVRHLRRALVRSRVALIQNANELGALSAIGEQTAKALATLLSGIVLGSAVLRIATAINGIDAVRVSAAYILPDTRNDVPPIGFAVAVTFATFEWIVLSLFILPLVDNFSEWRDHRVVQVNEGAKFLRTWWWILRNPERNLKERITKDKNLVTAVDGLGQAVERLKRTRPVSSSAEQSNYKR